MLPHPSPPSHPRQARAAWSLALVVGLLGACSSSSGGTAPPSTGGTSVGFAAAAPLCLAEQPDVVSLEVELSAGMQDETRVFFATSGSVSAADFDVLTPSPLVFPAGERSAVIQVVLEEDQVYELDEELVLSLTSAEGVAIGSTSTRTITIKHYELEPNDDVNEAAAIGAISLLAQGSGVDLHGVTSEEDPRFDVFRFEVASETTVLVALAGLGAGTDGVLWLASESGQVTHSANNAAEGGAESLQAGYTAGDVFHVVVLSFGAESTYELAVRTAAPATEPAHSGRDPLLDLGLSWSTLRDAIAARDRARSLEPRVLESLRLDLFDADGAHSSVEIETRLGDGI